MNVTDDVINGCSRNDRILVVKLSKLTDQGRLRPRAVQEVVQVAVDDLRVKVGAGGVGQAGFGGAGRRGHRRGEGSRVEAERLQRRRGRDAVVGAPLLRSRRRRPLTCVCTKRSTVSRSLAGFRTSSSR